MAAEAILGLLLMLGPYVTPAPAYRCDRPAPEPRSFHSRGFGHLAEIFPPHSRHNPGDKPVAYMYEVGYPGSTWKVEARQLWMATLVNARMPSQALMSMQADLVTLNEYDQPGYANALVIYDRAGRLVRGYSLVQLLNSDDLAHVETSDCGRQWNAGARYYFADASRPVLFVVLRWRTVLEFNLSTGEFRRGTVRSLPQLQRLLAQSSPNEETEVWTTSLRFSSITDLLSRK